MAWTARRCPSTFAYRKSGGSRKIHPPLMRVARTRDARGHGALSAISTNHASIPKHNRIVGTISAISSNHAQQAKAASMAGMFSAISSNHATLAPDNPCQKPCQP